MTDGREGLLLEVTDLEDAYAVITGLAATTAGLVLAGAPSKEASLAMLRQFVFEEAIKGENGAPSDQ